MSTSSSVYVNWNVWSSVCDWSGVSVDPESFGERLERVQSVNPSVFSMVSDLPGQVTVTYIPSGSGRTPRHPQVSVEFFTTHR